MRLLNINNFDAIHGNFEKLTNELYSKYLAKQTTARICVGSPSFHSLIARATNTQNDLAGQPKHEKINLFSETVTGLLEMLKLAKAQAEKK